MSGWHRLTKSIPWMTLLFVCAFLGFWQLVLPLTDVPQYILPLPSDIGIALWTFRDVWPHHVFITGSEALLGLLFALMLSFLLSVLMHRWSFLSSAFYPLLLVSQTIPILAISPLFIIWFDYSIWSKVAVVVLWSFFPLVIGLNDGLRNVSRDRKEMMLSLGASRWQQFRLLEFPSALPSFFSGFKLAAAYAVAGATVGEWLGASEGLGFFARRASSNLQVDLLFAAVCLLCLMGLLLFGLVHLAAKQALRRHVE